MSSQFIFADELRNACLYCALIGRLKYREELLRGVLPTEMEPTATVTFIRIDGNTYAVTAAHVISIFEELRASDGIPGLFSSQWRRGSWRMRLRSRAARQRAFRMLEPPAARIRL